MLETVPPGAKACPNRDLDAKSKLIASSVLNSIKSRLVILKIHAKKKIIIDNIIGEFNFLIKKSTVLRNLYSMVLL